jgi:hypothetical protein
MTAQAAHIEPQSGIEAVSKPSRKNAARRSRPIASWDRRHTNKLDRRTVEFKRYEALRAGVIADLGGEDFVTTAQAQIADRAAFICMMLEMMQIDALSGSKIDLQRFGELVDRGRRSFETIGLERRARDIEPDLDTYLASKREAKQKAAEAAPLSEPVANSDQLAIEDGETVEPVDDDDADRDHGDKVPLREDAA